MIAIIFKLLRCFVIAFTITYASTFGWRFMTGPVKISPENTQLREDLEKHVRELSHEIGPRSMRYYEGLIDARDYIFENLESWGYKVFNQDYIVYGKTVSNVIAVREGYQEHSGSIIVVGAHYDNFDNPGADDNASGVAGLLEIARTLSQVDTKHPVVFAAFVNEEPPFFKTEQMGSRVFVRNLKRRGKEVEAAIILESIGYYSEAWFSQRYPPLMGFFYPNRANFVILAGNRRSRKEKNRFFDLFRSKSRFPIKRTPPLDNIPGAEFSDHWSFWQDGYPAFTVTGTAFLRNKNYHKMTDTYDTLNYDYLAEVVRGLAKTVKEY
jgi:Zn-dependent M28 family amino/carboxypeptidase